MFFWPINLTNYMHLIYNLKQMHIVMPYIPKQYKVGHILQICPPKFLYFPWKENPLFFLGISIKKKVIYKGCNYPSTLLWFELMVDSLYSQFMVDIFMVTKMTHNFLNTTVAKTDIRRVRDWSLITGRGGLQNGKIAGPKLFAPPALKTG